MEDKHGAPKAHESHERKCPLCSKPISGRALAEARWMDAEVLDRLAESHPGWRRLDGACPACVQHALLMTLLHAGESALHDSIQSVWPLDAEAAFGALPTPLRMHADPRYTGKGVTVAFVDSGFYPHPDLVQPVNRLRAWVDVSTSRTRAKFFRPDEVPQWPGWDDRGVYQWHGLMTSAVATGNGWLSHGLYRGLASDAEIVFVQVRGAHGGVNNASILKALQWLAKNGKDLGVRIVNVSVGGEPGTVLAGNPIDETVAEIFEKGMAVVVAAGNEGHRRLAPPASAPMALTIGGIDDKNLFDHDEIELWHSNYGETVTGALKPELVAPSIWVVAPMIPGTPTANEAVDLFQRRAAGDSDVNARMAAQKYVTPHYQHVDGTSFAAPLAASVIACALEANPGLPPIRVRALLRAASKRVADAPLDRQGAGVLDAGQALALAVWDRHDRIIDYKLPPLFRNAEIHFFLHDLEARQVEVLGSWNEWKRPGLKAVHVENGVWKASLPMLPTGRYSYGFLLDENRWMDDPANPHKAPDPAGVFNSILIVP